MKVDRISAFSDGQKGGNPAGVYIADQLPSAEEMQKIAARVGYSETAFARPNGDGWRVRYFSPESEVPFCGHATIALGYVLGSRFGIGRYALTLNEADISVEAIPTEDGLQAKIQSPPTFSHPLAPELLNDVLELFSLNTDDLDQDLPPAFIHGGANHVYIGLHDRETLSQMSYQLDEGRVLMGKHGLVTIMLGVMQDRQLFHSRNAFASGGVLEDPATGAAAAAFAGYLRDISYPHGGYVQIIQGEDMGSRSIIEVELSDVIGSSVLVSGLAHKIE